MGPCTFEQLPGLDVEGRGEAVYQRKVDPSRLARLEIADGGLARPNPRGEFLLAQTGSFPEGAKVEG